MSNLYPWKKLPQGFLKVAGMVVIGMMVLGLPLASAEMESLSENEMTAVDAAPGIVLPLPSESASAAGGQAFDPENKGRIVDYRRIRDDALTSGIEASQVNNPNVSYPLRMRERTSSVTYPRIDAGSVNHIYQNMEVRETRRFSP